MPSFPPMSTIPASSESRRAQTLFSRKVSSTMSSAILSRRSVGVLSAPMHISSAPYGVPMTGAKAFTILPATESHTRKNLSGLIILYDRR